MEINGDGRNSYKNWSGSYHSSSSTLLASQRKKIGSGKESSGRVPKAKKLDPVFVENLREKEKDFVPPEAPSTCDHSLQTWLLSLLAALRRAWTLA